MCTRNLLASYTCSCENGWTGTNSTNCDQETCLDHVNGYSCVCPEETIGKNCETEYGDVIWHGTTSTNAQLIERIQYHCALVVSGAVKGSSYSSTRQELGPACTCGCQCETVPHYLLHCPMYNSQRSTLLGKLSRLIGHTLDFTTLSDSAKTDLLLRGIPFAGDCYQFSTLAASHLDATQACSANSGRMVDRRDPQQQQFLANTIAASTGVKTAPLPILYTPLQWLPGEPSSPLDLCVLLDSSNNYQAKTVFCTGQHNYAAGPDGIPGKLIKEFAFELSVPLTDVLNSSLRESTVPEEWKIAAVVPVPKTKPPSLNELRPISLTSLLSKVAEKFICQWAMTDILLHIDTQQFGGIKGRSTTHCLLDMAHSSFKACNRPNTICSIVSTDYSKAFDRVSHTVAIYRLLELGLRPSLVRWITDFLTSRSQAVRYHGVLSDTVPVTCGLPQGTLLGPLIFTAYINSAAQEAVSKRWNKAPHIPRPLTINNVLLQEVRSMKILGVHLQVNLKWNTHVDTIYHKASQRLYLLRKLKHFHLPIDDLVTVYVTYIRPVTEYAAPVGHSGHSTLLCNKLEKVQRRALRIIMGRDFISFSKACEQLVLPTLRRRREELTVKLPCLLNNLNSIDISYLLYERK
ncbi:hypothetical protein Bbelb_292510 [Branchiostoma belcheri]|nr:hypothetical protein Bbelb_292510 [Branchiostoma belcheri]